MVIEPRPRTDVRGQSITVTCTADDAGGNESPKANGGSNFAHGYSAYVKRGCRCETCRTAHAARWREYRSRPIDPGKHGTWANYCRGCRCEACKASPPTRAAYPAQDRRRYTRAIREWARENGHEVRETGQMPRHVIEAYETAHPVTTGGAA